MIATMRDLTHLVWPGWGAELAAAESSARRVSHGPGPGSHPDSKGLSYSVLRYDDVLRLIPRLDEVYRTPWLLQRVRQVTRDYTLERGTGPAALNVNYLRGVGAHYECHKDSAPYSVSWFASELGDEDGGKLRIHTLANGDHGPKQLHDFPCVLGQAVLFDGAAYYHEVTPLRAEVLRVSVVMQFLQPGAVRDGALDTHLYGDPDGN